MRDHHPGIEKKDMIVVVSRVGVGRGMGVSFKTRIFVSHL